MMLLLREEDETDFVFRRKKHLQFEPCFNVFEKWRVLMTCYAREGVIAMTDQPRLSDDTQINDPHAIGEAKKDTSVQDSHSTSETDRQTGPVKELIVAEYSNLTTELQNRQGIRYQMIQFALAALAALLTVSSVSIQNHLDFLIFAYPILVLVLSMIYLSNAFEGRRIKNYIQTRVEIFLPEKKGWYGYRHGDKIERLDSMGNMGAKTVFIVTSGIAVFIGIQIMHQDEISKMLLKVAVGATIILTILLLCESLAYEQARKWHWIEQPRENKEVLTPGEVDPRSASTGIPE
jgi:hypothetical protein